MTFPMLDISVVISIGRTNLVDAPDAISFSASMYCSVMVFPPRV